MPYISQISADDCRRIRAVPHAFRAAQRRRTPNGGGRTNNGRSIGDQSDRRAAGHDGAFPATAAKVRSDAAASERPECAQELLT